MESRVRGPQTTGERDAAWELYVEVVTRIAVVELKPGEGSLREALSSLSSPFATTRDILRKYGQRLAVRAVNQMFRSATSGRPARSLRVG